MAGTEMEKTQIEDSWQNTNLQMKKERNKS